MKIILYITCLLLILCSCSESDSSDLRVELDPATVLIKKEIFTKISGDIIIADFYYESNRLTSAKSSDGYEFSYFYENDVLSRVELSENGTVIIFVEINYMDSKLNNYTAYFNNNKADRFDFTYNSASSILVKRYSGNYTNQTFENDIDIILENGNIASVSFSGYSLHYEYDSRNCVYKNIFAIDVLNFIGLDYGGFEGITHNPISRSRTYLTDSESQTFVHSYNAIDFPDKTDIYLEGELEGTLEYFYE